MCETAAATAAKTVTISGFTLVTGSMAIVNFINGNTAASPTLNVNGTGAKYIHANTVVDSIASQYIDCGLLNLIYTGQEWIIIDRIDTNKNIISFTSKDSTSSTAWTNVSTLTSHETHSSLFNKISTMFKNVRYLYKLLGKTDISAIGDGTVTGILNGLQNKSVNITTSYTASKTINCIYNSTSCTLKLLNIENVTALTTIKIATLPEELRPGFEVIQDNVSPAGGHVRIYIKTDCTVYVYRYNNNDIYNLGIAITYLL